MRIRVLHVHGTECCGTCIPRPFHLSHFFCLRRLPLSLVEVCCCDGTTMQGEARTSGQSGAICGGHRAGHNGQETGHKDRKEAESRPLEHPLYSAVLRKERSVGGFKLSVAKSWLQKAVRRGEVGLALLAARELHSFARAPGTPANRQRIRTNFFHRLMIIFLEDVGQEPLWPQVDGLLQ
jgi:hypothetical protein